MLSTLFPFLAPQEVSLIRIFSEGKSMKLMELGHASDLLQSSFIFQNIFCVWSRCADSFVI